MTSPGRPVPDGEVVEELDLLSPVPTGDDRDVQGPSGLEGRHCGEEALPADLGPHLGHGHRLPHPNLARPILEREAGHPAGERGLHLIHRHLFSPAAAASIFATAVTTP